MNNYTISQASSISSSGTINVVDNITTTRGNIQTTNGNITTTNGSITGKGSTSTTTIAATGDITGATCIFNMISCTGAIFNTINM